MGCNYPYDYKKAIYTSDVSNGYIQCTRFQLYRGNANNITFNYGENAAFALYNPTNSDVNIFMDDLYYSNFSNYNLDAKYYLYGAPQGNLSKSSNVLNANTSKGYNIQGSGKLYSGKNVTVVGGNYYRDLIISADMTTRADNNGGILIAPGMYFILVVTALDSIAQNVTFGFGLNWWEEPIKRY